MCRVTSKIFLMVTAALFWAAAALLCVIGGYIFFANAHYEKVTTSTNILVPASLFFAVGVFLFLLGIVGCVGAYKEQKCLLAFFFIILTVIFLGLVTASVMSYVYRTDIRQKVKKGLDRGFHSYGTNDTNGWNEEIDYMQQQLECCGKHSYKDWRNEPWYKEHNDTQMLYPESCCPHSHCNYSHPANESNVFQEGCYDALHDYVEEHFMIMFGVAVALIVFQIIGIIASFVLLCQRRSEVPYIGLAEPGSLRV